MASVVPTVLATTPAEYQKMMGRAESLSRRVHVDICDGRFADNETINLAQVHASEQTQLDLHLMVKQPVTILETALSLHPNLLIFHAESEGDLAAQIKQTRDLGINAGLAILPTTPMDQVEHLVQVVDHVLIFTGLLGHNAGQFQMEQLERVAEIRRLKSEIEISVDGGVTNQEASEIAASGVDILYVGAYIQAASDPKKAFAAISSEAKS